MRVIRFLADGVSDRSYMVVDSDAVSAVVIDAQRDVWAYLDEAERQGVKITHTFDTHVHNDFISGSRSLAAVTGAVVVQAAEAGIEYPIREARDGDRIEVGSFIVRALFTPGHTQHHMSWVVEEAGVPVGVFTGGSLLVATIGRTDLVSPGATEAMARAQRESLRKLLALADDVEVFPTHGAGSFCSAGDVPDRETTSIGQEKRENAAARRSRCPMTKMRSSGTRCMGSRATRPTMRIWARRIAAAPCRHCSNFPLWNRSILVACMNCNVRARLS